MKLRHVRAGAMVLSFLMILPIVDAQMMGPRVILEYFQLVDDPTFESSPIFVINGTSEEFVGTHHSALGDDDDNYATLNWTHIANTTLDFNLKQDYHYPECNDFVFLYENISWNYEVLPSRCAVQYEFALNMSGDFATNPEGDEMFKYYVWFIDSSGNWMCVYSSNPSYSTEYQTRRIDLDYFDRSDVFRGMIQNWEGIQEDPSDDFQIAIGLAPTDLFRNYSSSEPWKTYNGSVALSVKQLEVHVAEDIIPGVPSYLPIVNNETWITPYSEWNPRYAMADDGSIYGVVQSSSYELNYSKHLLVKWDSMANIEWTRAWNETYKGGGKGVATHDDSVYTVGIEYTPDNTDMILTKWNSNGNLIWRKVVDTGEKERGYEVAVTPDGSIYTIVESLVTIQEDPYEDRFDVFLAKFDSNGNYLWNVTVQNWRGEYCRLHVHPNGTLYTSNFPAAGIHHWVDNIPTLITEAYYRDLAFSPEGDMYIAESRWPSVSIKRINGTGQVETLFYHEFLLPTLWPETVNADAITVTNDSIYMILKYESLNFGYELFKFDLEGNQLWNKTILDLTWRALWAYQSAFFMEEGSNGLLYIGGPMQTLEGGGDMGVAVLNPDNVLLPITSTSSTSITTNTTTGPNGNYDSPLVFMILIAGGIGAVIIVVIYFMKLKK